TSTADMAASTGSSRPPLATKSRYAPVVTSNPGGTRNPARASRASETPLPPTTADVAPGSPSAMTGGTRASTRYLPITPVRPESSGLHDASSLSRARGHLHGHQRRVRDSGAGEGRRPCVREIPDEGEPSVSTSRQRRCSHVFYGLVLVQ